MSCPLCYEDLRPMAHQCHGCGCFVPVKLEGDVPAETTGRSARSHIIQVIAMVAALERDWKQTFAGMIALNCIAISEIELAMSDGFVRNCVDTVP